MEQKVVNANDLSLVELKAVAFDLRNQLEQIMSLIMQKSAVTHTEAGMSEVAK